MAEMLIEIGAIASAHGIRGQFKVKAFCDDPMAITSYGALSLGDGRTLSVRAHSHTKGFVLCSAKEVTSRNAAEALRGQVLYVARDAMPQLEGDEFYHADLMGFEAVARGDARGGDAVGEIIGIYDFGAGTVIEIKRAGKKPVMVPFGDQHEPEIDEAEQRVIMNIAPQWLDDSKPEEEADMASSGKPSSGKAGG